VKRGDIRWYRFHAPDKKRPVLVLTRDSALAFLNEVTVAPVTRTVRGIPSEVELGTEDGVPTACAVNFDHLQTVSRGRLGGLVARLPSSRWSEVERALAFALGFSGGQ
jgi:mRNA interferase MazF